MHACYACCDEDAMLTCHYALRMMSDTASAERNAGCLYMSVMIVFTFGCLDTHVLVSI